jgi:hypothetical protein
MPIYVDIQSNHNITGDGGDGNYQGWLVAREFSA